MPKKRLSPPRLAISAPRWKTLSFAAGLAIGARDGEKFHVFVMELLALLAFSRDDDGKLTRDSDHDFRGATIPLGKA